MRSTLLAPHGRTAAVLGLALVLVLVGCGAEDGAPCARDADCRAHCTMWLDDGIPDALRPDGIDATLVCGPLRESGDDGRCEGPEECPHGLCALSGDCVVPCRHDGDCAVGQCRSLFAFRSAVTTARVDACAPRVATPPRVRVDHRASVHLEQVEDRSAVRVPARGASLQLFAVVDRQPYVDGIPQASFEAVLDEASGGFHFLDDLGYVGQWSGAPVPTIARPSAVPGAFSDGPLFLYLRRPEEIPVELIELRADTRGAALDLDVYVVTSGVEAQNRLESALPELARIFAGAGIVLGDVLVHRLPRSRMAQGVLRPPAVSGEVWTEQMARLLEGTAGLRRPSVPVFLVAGLPTGLLGLSPGVPGPQTVHGSEASGVFAAADLLTPTELASLIAHEVGHFLGLHHITSIDGWTHDGLSDTLECVDADRSGWVSADECPEGAENVMFPLIGGTSWSPMQAEVLQRAFVLR